MPYDKASIVYVLPNDIERCRTYVEEYLKSVNACGYRLLHQVQPAAFINYKDIEHTLLRKACLEGTIQVAVVRGGSYGVLCAAFLDGRHRKSEFVANVLRTRRYPVYIGDILNKDAIQEFISSHVLTRLGNEMTNSDKTSAERHGYKFVTNAPEKRTIDLVKRALFISIEDSELDMLYEHGMSSSAIEEFCARVSNEYRVYEEMALSAIINVPDIRIRGFSPKSLRPDIVVASVPPDSTPLLVIEFDGKDHLEKRQMIKDEMCVNMLNNAGIPVLRISSKNSLDACDIGFFNSYIKLLVYRIASVAKANNAIRNIDPSVQVVTADVDRLYNPIVERYDLDSEWYRMLPESYSQPSDAQYQPLVIEGQVSKDEGFVVTSPNGMKSLRIYIQLSYPEGFEDLEKAAVESALIVLTS